MLYDKFVEVLDSHDSGACLGPPIEGHHRPWCYRGIGAILGIPELAQGEHPRAVWLVEVASSTGDGLGETPGVVRCPLRVEVVGMTEVVGVVSRLGGAGDAVNAIIGQKPLAGC